MSVPLTLNAFPSVRSPSAPSTKRTHRKTPGA